MDKLRKNLIHALPAHCHMLDTEPDSTDLKTGSSQSSYFHCHGYYTTVLIRRLIAAVSIFGDAAVLGDFLSYLYPVVYL